jgi:hypothetical protein
LEVSNRKTFLELSGHLRSGLQVHQSDLALYRRRTPQTSDYIVSKRKLVRKSR